MFTSLIEYFTEKERRKIMELERSMELDRCSHELKLKKIEIEEKHIENGTILPENLDRLSMEHMNKSWKDEFIMLILFLPLLISFVPVAQISAATGFQIMSNIPNWYMHLLVAIVVVTYGLRSLVRFLSTNNTIKTPVIKVIKANETGITSDDNRISQDTEDYENR